MATKAKPANVWQALATVQAGMAGIRPQARGSKGNLYIDLDLLLSKARPLCAAAGLVIVHDTTTSVESGLMVVRSGVVLAREGSSVWVNVPVGPQNPGVTREEAAAGVVHWAPHAIASAFSYGRRYGLAALFAVSERDDDGSVAQATVQAAAAAAPAPTPVRQAVSHADKPSAMTTLDRHRDDERRHRAVVTMIHCAKQLAFIDDSADDMPNSNNIGAVAVMVGEVQGLDTGKAADLKTASTADLVLASEYWQDKADEANDLPL